MLEQRFAEFDNTVRTRPDYNLDEESNSDIDVDMSQPATSRGKTQTGSYVDDLESSELFELCSALDSLETESNDSDHRLEKRTRLHRASHRQAFTRPL